MSTYGKNQKGEEFPPPAELYRSDPLDSMRVRPGAWHEGEVSEGWPFWTVNGRDWFRELKRGGGGKRPKEKGILGEGPEWRLCRLYPAG